VDDGCLEWRIAISSHIHHDLLYHPRPEGGLL
jgi:hypothetical protein